MLFYCPQLVMFAVHCIFTMSTILSDSCGSPRAGSINLTNLISLSSGSRNGNEVSYITWADSCFTLQDPIPLKISRIHQYHFLFFKNIPILKMSLICLDTLISLYLLFTLFVNIESTCFFQKKISKSEMNKLY